MAVDCGEFARRYKTLLEGASGYPGIAELMTLSRSQGHYHVISLEVGPPYWDKLWVDQHFSSDVASWILSSRPPTAPNPITQAWQAFDFPAGTQAVQE